MSTRKYKRCAHMPYNEVPLAAELSQKPDDAPLVVYTVPDPHPSLENPDIPISFRIGRNFELKSIAMPQMSRKK